MLRIDQAYWRLINRIVSFKEYDFYNQLRRTGKNKDDIKKIKETCSLMQRDLDRSFNFYLYKEDKWLQMDIYSRSGYEGSIKGGNLKHIGDKIRKLYLEAKQRLGLG